ncbi:hypothetical protein ACFQ44_05890 [Levilactobacillus lanxiensis]|uniref:ArpU family transcriptional regulator n=1 Tax=Levilactobacillus lanxiensis TaxID=2799568 RepID=A0ABW4D591_9LACO|nr:hypothetical protein [Levilactobacillus lanxiensis]
MEEQLSVSEKIHRKEIRKSVKRYFSQDFERLALLSGTQISALQSPQYDGMPKAPGVTKNFDDDISEQADQQVIFDCTLKALRMITGVSCYIIWHSLVQHELEGQVRRQIHYQHARYIERKNAALEEFYYAFVGQLSSRGITIHDLKFSSYL